MDDLEISKRLALAIGWKPEQINEFPKGHISMPIWIDGWLNTPLFDYRDWSVIGPIAERYDCFPHKDWSGTWDVINVPVYLYADTPQKAIALAVIGAKEKSNV